MSVSRLPPRTPTRPSDPSPAGIVSITGRAAMSHLQLYEGHDGGRKVPMNDTMSSSVYPINSKYSSSILKNVLLWTYVNEHGGLSDFSRVLSGDPRPWVFASVDGLCPSKTPICVVGYALTNCTPISGTDSVSFSPTGNVVVKIEGSARQGQSIFWRFQELQPKGGLQYNSCGGVALLLGTASRLGLHDSNQKVPQNSHKSELKDPESAFTAIAELFDSYSLQEWKDGLKSIGSFSSVKFKNNSFAFYLDMIGATSKAEELRKNDSKPISTTSKSFLVLVSSSARSKRSRSRERESSEDEADDDDDDEDEKKVSEKKKKRKKNMRFEYDDHDGGDDDDESGRSGFKMFSFFPTPSSPMTGDQFVESFILSFMTDLDSLKRRSELSGFLNFPFQQELALRMQLAILIINSKAVKNVTKLTDDQNVKLQSKIASQYAMCANYVAEAATKAIHRQYVGYAIHNSVNQEVEVWLGEKRSE